VEKVLVLPHITRSRNLVKMKGIVICPVIQITVHMLCTVGSYMFVKLKVCKFKGQ